MLCRISQFHKSTRKNTSYIFGGFEEKKDYVLIQKVTSKPSLSSQQCVISQNKPIKEASREETLYTFFELLKMNFFSIQHINDKFTYPRLGALGRITQFNKSMKK